MATAAAAVAIAERRMVEAFERAGATSPERARTPDELAVEPESRSWRRLANRAVIREAGSGSGRFYLDRDVWQAVRRTRKRMAIVLLLILLGVWLYIATVGVLRASSRLQQESRARAQPSP